MPNRDKTGPAGQGPLTGRGMGPCAGGTSAGMGAGMGRGMGRGRGLPAARSFSGGWCPCPYIGISSRKITPEDEKAYLEEEKKALEEERKAIDERLEELK